MSASAERDVEMGSAVPGATDEMDITSAQLPLQQTDVDISENAEKAKLYDEMKASNMRAKEQELAKAQNHNYALLDSWVVFFMRVLVTGFYMLSLLFVMGFSLNALLQMHFSFFLPNTQSSEESAISFLSVLCMILAIGFICAVWLSRIVELVSGTWSLKYTYLYDMVKSLCPERYEKVDGSEGWKFGNGRRNRVVLDPKTGKASGYPWPSGVLMLVDGLAFGLPIIVSLVMGFVTLVQGDELVTVAQMVVFAGLGTCALVSLLFLLIAVFAAIFDPVFDEEPVVKEIGIDERRGCAAIVSLLFAFWMPNKDSHIKLLSKSILAGVSDLVLFVLLMLLVADSGNKEESWMLVLLPTFVFVGLAFTFAVLAELRVRRYFAPLPGDGGETEDINGNAITPEQLQEEKKKLADMQDKMSRISLLSAVLSLVVIGMFMGENNMYTGVAVVICIIASVALVAANMPRVVKYLRLVIKPEEKESKAAKKGHATAFTSDKFRTSKNVSYTTIFHRWLYDLIYIEDRADLIRTIIFSLLFIIYMVGVYGAFAYLNKVSGAVMVVALLLSGFFTSVKNSTKSSVVYSFLGFLVFLGLAIIMLGSQVADPDVGVQGAWANITTEIDPNSVYQICNTTWHDYNIVDYAFMSKIAYFDSKSGLAANESNVWFPGVFNVTKLEDAEPSVVLALRAMDSDVTVIAVRGTTRMSDWIEDMDMFLESVMIMPVASMFPANITAAMVDLFGFMKEVTKASGREYWRYVLDATKRVMDEEPDRKYVVTGHSLGGGIAKVVGARLHIPAIAFSGPGIVYSRNIFDVTWHEINTYAVNVVPRADVVPKVGSLGGVIQHIDCNFGALACHFIDNTACELLHRCGDTHNRSISAKLCEAKRTKPKD